MPRHSSVHPVPLHQAPGPEAGSVLSGFLSVAILMVGLAPIAPAGAASALLESVKQNPQLARSLCERFKRYNAEGKLATSKESIDWVAASQGLSPMDAEVLTTYVIGLYCPDVR
ncbi:MAG: hypothetical protein WAM11_14095 [Cyanobium sp.]